MGNTFTGENIEVFRTRSQSTRVNVTAKSLQQYTYKCEFFNIIRLEMI